MHSLQYQNVEACGHVCDVAEGAIQYSTTHAFKSEISSAFVRGIDNRIYHHEPSYPTYNGDEKVKVSLKVWGQTRTLISRTKRVTLHCRSHQINASFLLSMNRMTTYFVCICVIINSYFCYFECRSGKVTDMTLGLYIGATPRWGAAKDCRCPGVVVL